MKMKRNGRVKLPKNKLHDMRRDVIGQRVISVKSTDGRTNLFFIKTTRISCDKNQTL
jgi:hypothetical protein